MDDKHMKSDEVRKNWADVLLHVRTGGTVVVEHYTKPVADVVPHGTALRLASSGPGTRQAIEEYVRTVIEQRTTPNDDTSAERLARSITTSILHRLGADYTTSVRGIANKETSMDTDTLTDQVTATLGDSADDFDVDAIVEEIGDTYGRDNVRGVDDVPSNEYWVIVRKHER
jgi:antitoxin (DNA-binding transcriptional repressor) of toxin-antitoxin stability system